MFNDDRTEKYGVSTADPIKTTLTTKGYLSDGCSHPVTINGGYGNDFFDILRNKCILGKPLLCIVLLVAAAMLSSPRMFL